MGMSNRLVIIALMFIQTYSWAQMTLTTVVTQNTVCNGTGCNYNSSYILINEVMLCPSVFDGSIYGTGPGFSPNTNAGEWIELYNPDLCYPKDISGFLLGNNAPESGINRGGGFVIPPNTVIPSRGFCVIRGVNATPVQSNLLIQNGGNTLEIVVSDSLDVCIDNGLRFWLPNSGGWVALYDRYGNPLDAISWATPSGSCTSYNPCIPLSSTYTGTIPSYDMIPATLKNYISADLPTSGLTFRRIPDGSIWQVSTPGSPTLGTCNSGCITPSVVTCNGTAEVTVQGGTPPYSYYWDGGSSPINSLDTGLCGGVYTVMVTDNSGNTAATSVSIPNWIPNASFTLSPDTICFNNTSTVTYTGDVSDTATYIWSASGVSLNSYTGEGPHLVTATVEGVHDVSLIVTQNGCISPPTEHSIFVYSIGAALNTIHTPICYQSATGELAATGNSGTAPYHYSWNNNVQGQNNPNIASGNYIVTVTDAIGCTASASIILPDQTPIETTISTAPESCVNSCDGEAVAITSGSTAPYTYHWQNGNSNTNEVQGLCAGNFSVTVTDANSCSATFSAIVDEAIPVQAAGFATPTMNIAPADVQFTFNGSNAVTYLWFFGDGTNSTLQNPLHQYAIPGIYNVSILVTSGAPNFCSDSITIHVEIMPPSTVTIPNIFTPNNDGFNDGFYAISEGIEQESLKIFNRWGRVVYVSEIVSSPWNGNDPNGNESADGTYFYVYHGVGYDKKEYNLNGSITLMR